MNTTRALRHNAEINGCGGTFVGDWEVVECTRCGLPLNTLDVPNITNGKLADDEVLRLTPNGLLIAVAVNYTESKGA